MTDHEDTEVEHRPCNCLPPWTECRGCGAPWPCDIGVVEDVVDDIYCALHLIPREGSAPDYLKDAIDKLVALNARRGEAQ